ncbi:hypothetical protein E3V39_11620 [Gammaproteobacteria bacterium LSUCC0112]|nr:hypothetical protein E3V39_11620 [Gammaproteobacteria bacterium LSUCC0112]
MSILVWFIAAFKLGIPVAGMSWLMFNWLYGAGQLSRSAGHKAIREQLEQIKKSHKTNKAKSGNYLYRQWMMFGGGFYGLAVLWTLLSIEVLELIGFLFNFNLQELLADGVIAMIVNFIVAQFGNIVTAVVWFAYWPDGDQPMLPWILVAYAGYLIGIHLAREQQTLHGVKDLVPVKQFNFRKKLAGTDHDSHTKGNEVSPGMASGSLADGADGVDADPDRSRDG